jgi:putative FmdB family regulatory protein
MPIYEYECSKCGHQTEVWQQISEKPLSKCEICNGKMKKLISQSTFHLKGSGWYVTDYNSKGSPPSAGKKEASAKGTENTTKETKSPANASEKGTPSTKEKKAEVS